VFCCFSRIGVVFTGRREGEAGSSWGVDESGPGFWTGPIKDFGPWRFLKSLGLGHFKRRPLRKPKSKSIWCTLKKTKPGSHSGCFSLDVDAGHGVPSPPVLVPEAKALVSLATTSEDSRRGGCSPSQVGAGGSSPSAIRQLGSS
jgi:hypothetical protein